MSAMSQFFGGGATIKSIQRGLITISTSDSSATATISAVNTSKTELRFLGASNTGTTLARIELTNSTTITATRIGFNQTNIVSWELTEWN
jgi:hypothetical protein